MNAHVLACREALDTAIPRDFIMLCLWSACGLALSGLFCIAGVGIDVMQGVGRGRLARARRCRRLSRSIPA